MSLFESSVSAYCAGAASRGAHLRHYSLTSCLTYAAPKRIMQQYLEKSFPMAAELSEREVDLLAYQVRNVTLLRQISVHVPCKGECRNDCAGAHELHLTC